MFSPLLFNTKSLFGGFLPLRYFSRPPYGAFIYRHAEQVVCIYSFILGNGLENSVSVLIQGVSRDQSEERNSREIALNCPNELDPYHVGSGPCCTQSGENAASEATPVQTVGGGALNPKDVASIKECWPLCVHCKSLKMLFNCKSKKKSLGDDELLSDHAVTSVCVCVCVCAYMHA